VSGLAALRAVIFDLDDTLTDRKRSIWRYAQTFARAFRTQLTVDNQSVLASQLRAADRDGYNPDRAKDITALPIWATPVEAATVAAHWAEYFAPCAVPREQCRETLLALRACGMRLAVITNGGSSSQRDKLQTLGIVDLFDAIVISEELGAKKPDPRIFRAALERLNLAAAECVFIGDNPEKDVRGASLAGIHVIWFESSLTWPPALPGPTYQIHGLNELLPLLGFQSGTAE
jgi:putative hydrolase of the HAD superfamily